MKMLIKQVDVYKLNKIRMIYGNERYLFMFIFWILKIRVN